MRHRGRPRHLAAIPGMDGRWGFRDSLNVQTRTRAATYLSLEEGMIMAALGNALGGDGFDVLSGGPGANRSAN